MQFVKPKMRLDFGPVFWESLEREDFDWAVHQSAGVIEEA